MNFYKLTEQFDYMNEACSTNYKWKYIKKKILNILQKLKKNCDTYHNGNNIMKKISMFKELAEEITRKLFR